jgi:hypothetical protein
MKENDPVLSTKLSTVNKAPVNPDKKNLEESSKDYKE